MQTFTLNIGLRTSLNQFNEETRGGAEFALTEQDQKFEALMACALLGGHNCRWEVQESNTERTLVVQFDLRNLIANEIGSFMLTVKFLADTLDQDCIAVYSNTTGYGVLVGGYSHEWGEFNKEYFLQYKGEQRIDKISRNLVDYEAGKTILEAAFGCYKQRNVAQSALSF